MSANLLDKQKNHSVVSGLASDGRRLYVADSRENLIRVVSVALDLAPKIEILDADGKQLFATNCGGPPVGDFQGECPELVDRAFPFERPGPMAVDKRGELWIIQRGNDFPIGGLLTAKYKAAVRCHQPDGTFTGREITDVVNPRALAYDAANDRLLVGENGPDLNVRIYGGLGSRPVLARTFGEQGGIYAGRNPGLVNDPSAGGAARFAGVSGVGVDDRGTCLCPGVRRSRAARRTSATIGRNQGREWSMREWSCPTLTTVLQVKLPTWVRSNPANRRHISAREGPTRRNPAPDHPGYAQPEAFGDTTQSRHMVNQPSATSSVGRAS